jgi:hypothetical protein
MAPIAPQAESVDPLSAVVDSALDKGEAREKLKGSGQDRPRRIVAAAALWLLALALVGGGGWYGWRWYAARPAPAAKKPAKAPAARPKPEAAPVVQPTAEPAYPRRGTFMPPDEVLPSEVLPATPVPAGWTTPMGRAEDLEYHGEGRLPLPTHE